MAKIGFIGLGHMGLPMAKNLVSAGHTVSGFDLQTSLVKDLQAFGGHSNNSIAEVAADKDCIITMLQTGKQVMSVCDGDEGIFSNAKPGTLYIDCSTVDVTSARNIHHLAAKFNMPALDAPVSGGVAGAAAASLTFMVGGSQQDFEIAKPILSAMGAKIIYTGDAGSGQAAKICNNMMLGISMIASSEAFVLGKALGLSAKKLHEVVTNASGHCWVMDKYVPVPGVLDTVPAENDYAPGFTTAMMLKDLNLSQESAQTAGVKTKLAKLAQQIYQKAYDDNLAEKDFSAIIQELDG